MTESADGTAAFFSAADERGGTVRQFRTLVDSLDSGLFQVDSAGELTAVNDALVDLTGVEKAALRGSHVSTILGDSGAARFRATAGAIREAGVDDAGPIDVTVSTASGDAAPYRLHLSALESDEQDGETAGILTRLPAKTDGGEGVETVASRYESLVDDVLDGADVGVFVLDADFRVAWINEATERYFGLDREDVVGRDKRAVLEEEIPERVANPDEFAEAVLATDDDADTEAFECRVDPGDGGRELWLEHRSEPIESGLHAGGRVELYYDVTDLMRSRRRLREETAFTESLLEAQPDLVYAFDEHGQLLRWNDRLSEVTGYSDAVIADMEPLEFVSGEASERAVSTLGDVLDTGEGRTVEADLKTKGGELIPYQFSGAPIRDGAGDVVGLTGVGRDISRLEAQARRLERQRDDLEAELDEVFERIDDAFFALDDEWRFTYVNDQAVELLEETAADLRQCRLWEGLTWSSHDRIRAEFERAMDRQEAGSFEVRVDSLDSWFRIHVYPSESGVSVYFRDVTERKERERALAESEQRFRTVFESAKDAILILDDDRTVAEANQEAAGLFGYPLDSLRGRRLDDLVPDGYELADSWAEFLDDGEREGTYPIRRRDGSQRVVEYSSRADVLPGKHLSIQRDITEQERRKRELEAQRERLAVLDNLNGVVRDITDAVIEQSTREEIEAIVCERLAAADSYCFAWLGDVDSESGSLTPRLEAGVDGYFDDVSLSVGPDDTAGRGPIGRVVETGRIQVTRDVFGDPDFETWRDHAREHGYRAAAAIPIVHAERLYGVIGVYSEREGAFAAEEREVLRQLGEVVGHAIAAVEREQALMSDEVLEIDIRIADVLADVGVSTELSDSVSLERLVPVGGEEYLMYGNADADDVPAVEQIVEALPPWQSVRVLDGGRDRVDLEIRLSGSPLLREVTSRGGYVTDAKLDGGDYHVTVQLSPGGDARRLLDAVQERYSTASVRAQRQVTRTNDGLDRARSAYEDALTDRQRAAVETAYFSGYFEWPRTSSGEDVAGLLDISPATFSQHLRAAENSLFETLFDDAGRD